MSVYNHIFQIMNQPMLLMSQNEIEVRIEDANQAFLRLCGYTLKELQSKKAAICFINIRSTFQGK